ncbi:hypothetical protein G6F36_015643 [Rhizopus arrhizus]|nr:hypothetical protein G6F36_015643 [Rhizopus arrhizus]
MFTFRTSILQSRTYLARNPALKRTYATQQQNNPKSSSGNAIFLGLVGAIGLGFYFNRKPDNYENAAQVFDEKMYQAKKAVGDKVDDAKDRIQETKKDVSQAAQAICG